VVAHDGVIRMRAVPNKVVLPSCVVRKLGSGARPAQLHVSTNVNSHLADGSPIEACQNEALGPSNTRVAYLVVKGDENGGLELRWHHDPDGRSEVYKKPIISKAELGYWRVRASTRPWVC